MVIDIIKLINEKGQPLLLDNISLLNKDDFLEYLIDQVGCQLPGNVYILGFCINTEQKMDK